jgi:hypothetical protein
VRFRRQGSSKRFEVGYAVHRGMTDLGVYASSPVIIICGRGNTWEEAFADADADLAGKKSPVFTAPQ